MASPKRLGQSRVPAISIWAPDICARATTPDRRLLAAPFPAAARLRKSAQAPGLSPGRTPTTAKRRSRTARWPLTASTRQVALSYNLEEGWLERVWLLTSAHLAPLRLAAASVP